jgi:hypothetical protein
VEVASGLMQEECTEILQRFFKDLRKRNKMRKKSAAAETADLDSEPESTSFD